MNISIRPAVVEDVREIANVVSVSVTSLLAEDYTSEQISTISDYLDADFYLEAIETNIRILLVAEAEKIVGFGAIARNGRAITEFIKLTAKVLLGSSK